MFLLATRNLGNNNTCMGDTVHLARRTLPVAQSSVFRGRNPHKIHDRNEHMSYTLPRGSRIVCMFRFPIQTTTFFFWRKKRKRSLDENEKDVFGLRL